MEFQSLANLYLDAANHSELYPVHDKAPVLSAGLIEVRYALAC